MSEAYEPNLLKTKLKGHIVTDVGVWHSGRRIDIKTDKGAYIYFEAILIMTENGIFPELRRVDT